jgi:hypothetical protein
MRYRGPDGHYLGRFCIYYYFSKRDIKVKQKERVICLPSPHCAFQDGIYQAVICKPFSIRISIYVRPDILFSATYIL